MPHISPQCSLCNHTPETPDHIFSTSSFTNLVWERFPTSIIRPSTSSSFHQWFWFLARPQNQRLGALISWHIWKAHSKYIFNSNPLNPWTIIRKTTWAIHEWNVAAFLPCLPPTTALRKETWAPPPLGKIKLNFDAAVNINKNIAGIGGIIRDKNKDILTYLSC